MVSIDFDYRLFNPNFHHAIKYLKDDSLRYLFFWGGSSSSKTYSVVQAILILTLQDKRNSLIFRKVSSSIDGSIYNTFKVVIETLKLKQFFKLQKHKIICSNGAVIDFNGLDDSEKIKGIESYYRIMFDEITEGEFDDFKQLRKRMRGIEGQKFISTFNPIDEGHWLKTEIFDRLQLVSQETIINNNPLTEVSEVQRVSNYIFVKSTYLNNYYVVGSPDGKWGFKDEHTINDFEQDKLLDYNFYCVYALAEWGKLISGSEFYKQFDRIKHVKDVSINYELPLHISIDENVRPYLPLTISQIENGEIRVIDEICGKNPNNNINDVIRIFSNNYSEWFNKKVFVYGDATSRRADARTENGYNLFGIITSELQNNGFKDVVVRVPNTNPSVSQSGRFMNMLLANMISGYKLIINSKCINTINDFLYLKEDKDGNILKERVKNKQDGTTYEKWGHCFVGETLITTINGDVPIKNIKIGDYVLTRNGYKKVLGKFNNGFKEVKTYNIDGTLLTCTPEHKIYTLEKDFIPIHLTNNVTEPIYTLCKLKQSNTEELDSQGIQTQKMSQTKGITMVKKLDTMFTNTNIQLVNDVQTVSEVYDIEVEDEHEYFANGILVHNCSDSIRYLCSEYLREEFNKIQNKNTSTEFFTINIDDDLLAF